MKRIIWFLPVFCCLYSCQPLDDSETNVRLNVCHGKYVHINGQLMDAYSREGLPYAKFEVKLNYYDSSDYFCWGCFSEVIGSTETDQDGYFDFKLPLDSMDINYTYYITISKNSYFGKEMIIEHFSKLDTLYNLSLYMNRKSKISLRYTNTITNTNNKLISYFYRVTPDTSLYEDDCPFGVYEDYHSGYRYYVDANARTFGTEDSIITPCVITTDCDIMQYETKEIHYLVFDTFSVAWNEPVAKSYVLKFP